MSSKITLVTGGARSGKSDYALSLAKSAKKPSYIATGWAGDDEMSERIRKHRKQRGGHWTTIEERFHLADAIEKAAKQDADFIIVDCLTLWTSNMTIEERAVKPELDRVVKLLREAQNLPPVVFVTNEVGCGIVPGDRLSREFRDAAGTVNRKVAELADEVYLCVCGIPVRAK